MSAKPVAQGASADAYRALLLQTHNHLVERNVLLILDHPDDEVCIAVETRTAPSPLRARLQFADLRSCDPADGARYPDAKPARRLAPEAFKTRNRKSPLRALAIIYLRQSRG